MTGEDEQKEVSSTVFNTYLLRFKEILWDSYLITLAVTNIDIERITEKLESVGTRERVLDSLGRMGTPKREGYTIYKLSLTLHKDMKLIGTSSSPISSTSSSSGLN